ncbi:enhanced serine sensitivity protein SseB C-terminal domain-containing protein [Rhodanobacter thiooxydans]|uniref:enhanced serine sensitivity protein SseB C-terminal domain-containing protein n=1 Tax=Rhodanobacter thiooxydans TaxID=416169 RepID=UPI001F4851F8|nr:enhanced serine sensitivity protein SseB C-terminal domain-containing protein [Rhodanobacter thiooxydans]
MRDGISIVAMSGRRLFELTRGATLMLNPNIDAVALYPPEITAILEGRELGYFAQQEPIDNEVILAGPPSVSTNEVDEVLRELFEQEGTVRAAYLAEVNTQSNKPEEFILLGIVAASVAKERLLQLVTLALKTKSPRMDLPLSIAFFTPDEALPDICHRGIQFYGT